MTMVTVWFFLYACIIFMALLSTFGTRSGVFATVFSVSISLALKAPARVGNIQFYFVVFISYLDFFWWSCDAKC